MLLKKKNLYHYISLAFAFYCTLKRFSVFFLLLQLVLFEIETMIFYVFLWILFFRFTKQVEEGRPRGGENEEKMQAWWCMSFLVVKYANFDFSRKKGSRSVVKVNINPRSVPPSNIWHLWETSSLSSLYIVLRYLINFWPALKKEPRLIRMQNTAQNNYAFRVDLLGLMENLNNSRFRQKLLLVVLVNTCVQFFFSFSFHIITFMSLALLICIF